MVLCFHVVLCCVQPQVSRSSEACERSPDKVSLSLPPSECCCALILPEPESPRSSGLNHTLAVDGPGHTPSNQATPPPINHTLSSSPDQALRSQQINTHTHSHRRSSREGRWIITKRSLKPLGSVRTLPGFSGQGFTALHKRWLLLLPSPPPSSLLLPLLPASPLLLPASPLLLRCLSGGRCIGSGPGARADPLSPPWPS